MFKLSDGGLLANVDLPAYLSSSLADADPLSSFCLLQVSADLSTAVAVTRSRSSVAVDLNHYFRYCVSFCGCPSVGAPETLCCFLLPGRIQTTCCVLHPPVDHLSSLSTPETRTACRAPPAASRLSAPPSVLTGKPPSALWFRPQRNTSSLWPLKL